jgi:flagellar protein FlbD
MIHLTKINGEPIMVNADLIETITANPDTVIQFTNGKTIILLESPDEVRRKVIEFRREILAGPQVTTKNEE